MRGGDNVCICLVVSKTLRHIPGALFSPSSSCHLLDFSIISYGKTLKNFGVLDVLTDVLTLTNVNVLTLTNNWCVNNFFHNILRCYGKTNKFFYQPNINLVFKGQVAQTVKNPPEMWETWAQYLGWQYPGGGHGNPLQYSCLENPMDRGAWRGTVHGVSESDVTKWLSIAILYGYPQHIDSEGKIWIQRSSDKPPCPHRLSSTLPPAKRGLLASSKREGSKEEVS